MLVSVSVSLNFKKLRHTTFPTKLAEEMQMDLGGSEDVEEGVVMNRSPKDDRQCQVGRQVIIAF